MLKKEKIKIDAVYDACEHFEGKMKRSRKRLRAGIEKSKPETYARKEYLWKHDYDALMLIH